MYVVVEGNHKAAVAKWIKTTEIQQVRQIETCGKV